MPSVCARASWNCSFALETVFRHEVPDDLLELLVGELVAELPRPLDQQQLVDGAGDHLGRHLGEHPIEFRIGARLEAPLAYHADLALFQLGLGDDVAVDLDQNLLEDDALRRLRGRSAQ